MHIRSQIDEALDEISNEQNHVNKVNLVVLFEKIGIINEDLLCDSPEKQKSNKMKKA